MLIARNLVCCFVGCLCTFMISAANADDVNIAKAAKKVKQIVAHRGASLERPECTLVSCRRAIDVGATAIEVDVRTSKDGHLVILHDRTLDRTTDGTGPVNKKTLAELKKLDAGSWVSKRYRNERIPTLREVLKVCKGKTDVLLDLKESGAEYDKKVVNEVNKYGDSEQIVIGVRSVEQARRLRKLLPKARQIGLIPDTKSIEAFAKAGVETIRLWPKWLTDSSLVERVRKAGAKLHLNGSTGKRDEVIPLLKHAPDSLSSDDPKRLIRTLRELAASEV